MAKLTPTTAKFSAQIEVVGGEIHFADGRTLWLDGDCNLTMPGKNPISFLQLVQAHYRDQNRSVFADVSNGAIKQAFDNGMSSALIDVPVGFTPELEMKSDQVNGVVSRIKIRIRAAVARKLDG